jgi:neutral ceramidase
MRMPRRGLALAAAWQVIDVPEGATLAGYDDRAGPALGVHDPLGAGVWLLVRPRGTIALVALDLIHVRRALAQAVRRTVQARLAEGVHTMVFASHTHSGPEVPGTDDAVTLPVGAAIVAAVDRAVQTAAQRLEPGRLTAASGRVTGLGTNRIDPRLPIDDGVGILCGESASGRVVLIDAACHPTVLGAENRLVSADFPGEVRARIRARWGDDTVVLFANGAAADVSTRSTRRASSFAEAARFGAMVADAALDAWTTSHTAVEAKLGFSEGPVDLALRPAEDPELLRARLERMEREVHGARGAGTGADGPDRSRYVEMLGIRSVLTGSATLEVDTQVVVQACSIGDGALVALPGEPFTSQARSLRAQARGAPLRVVGYANAHAGYLVDDDTSPGYERSVARIEPSSTATLLRSAVEHLARARARAEDDRSTGP